MYSKVVFFIDRVNKAAFLLSSIFAFVLVILTTQQVLSRYLFNQSSVAIQELEWHLFGAMFLLAGASTYKSGGHVRVDVLHRKFSKGGRKLVESLGILIFLFPTCGFLIYYGWEFTLQARDFATSTSGEGLISWILRGERSSDPGGLGARWIIRSTIPISGVLLGLQGISQLLKLFIENNENSFD